MITVYYDGKCGLCNREISHYKKIAPANTFIWQDITRTTDDLNELGISLATGLKYLHAKDKEGQLHVGVDAFILIWSHLKRWRLLAALARSPLIYPLANLAYKAFAKRRFQQHKHCQVALEAEKDKHSN